MGVSAAPVVEVVNVLAIPVAEVVPASEAAPAVGVVCELAVPAAQVVPVVSAAPESQTGFVFDRCHPL